jgi:16S rRNA processing protein RimM
MSENRRSTLPGKTGQRKKSQVYRIRNQEVVVPDGCLAVGHIVGVHGLRGEVKVELYTDFPERFAQGETLLLGADLSEVEIIGVRPHKQNLLMHFGGVVDRTAAERLRGLWLFVPESEAAELADDVYWIHDIIGLRVLEADGRVLGEIVQVLATGANDVYIVRPGAGQNRGQEILLPAIPDVVLAIDLAQGTMTVRVPDGLLDAESVD